MWNSVHLSSVPTKTDPDQNLLPGVPGVESPLFGVEKDGIELTPEQQEIAFGLRDRGYAVIDFPDPKFDERSERIKQRLAPMFGMDLNDPETVRSAQGNLRVQDAWRFDEDVKAIAANAQILELLNTLYGRRAFPFQTLNFPVGTQQALHTDSVHFSSIPERFMCGVWVAMEDIKAAAGPLVYLPGSHRWPVLTNALVGRRGWGVEQPSAQTPFERVWAALADASALQPERFLARKGQALIWAANLLHGGDEQADRSMTRWSQVTHYYFGNCIYYTPAFSDEPLGLLDLRTITNVATGETEPNLYAGEVVQRVVNAPPRRGLRWLRRQFFGPSASDLPPDFDPAGYQLLNPDVAASGLSPADHYLRLGRDQGRQYSLK